nr:helix-turn-helix domain-containing protein [Dorea sp. OM07-5]
MNNTRPSFYLISSAVDGNVNSIEKILALYDPYISKCCLRPFINRSTSFRSRKNSLEEIKKKLKENMNDE